MSANLGQDGRGGGQISRIPAPAGIEHDAMKRKKVIDGIRLTSPDDRGPLSPYDDNEVVWRNKRKDLYF